MVILDTQVTSFADNNVWNTVLQFCVIGTALLVGNILRHKIPYLKKSLVPSALLGGIAILILKGLFAYDIVDKVSMEMVTYHALGLGFVALALKNNRIQSKSSSMTVIETGAVTANTYVIQGIVGLLVTIPLFYFFKLIFYPSGMLLPMGFGQGPGQALNFGVIFSGHAAEQNIDFAGADFGLSIAATGFIAGSIIGVIYLSHLKRKGIVKQQQLDERHNTKLTDYVEPNEIPDSDSIDKLSVQMCLVLLVYLLVYLFTEFVQELDLGDFGTKTLKPLLWGFNFLTGTLFGIFVKWIMNRCKRAKILEKEYVNNYLLNRISGFFFDVMIVAGTAAINFKDFGGFIVPFVLVCVFGALATFLYLRAASRHLFKGYENEGFLSMFGMLTGTASNGMILLREIDPKFETPAANNLVLQNFPAILLGFPILLLMGFAPLSFTNTIITFVILLAIFIVLNIFIFRRKIWKKKK